MSGGPPKYAGTDEGASSPTHSTAATNTRFPSILRSSTPPPLRPALGRLRAMADDPTSGPTIEAYYLEERTCPPPEGFKKNALVVSQSIYDEANEDWQGFWARQALELLDWYDEWDTILEWDLPFARWFVNGRLNVSYNCLYRHVAA